MVKVTLNDGKFSVKGTFDFGYIGLLKDDEFYIHHYIEEMIVDREGEGWDETAKLFGIKGTSDEDIADALTIYINDFEAKIQKNKKQVNDSLIAKIAENFEACGNPIWEAHEDLLILEYLSYEDNLYTPESKKIIRKIVSDFEEEPNDGSMEKIDAEAAMRKLFPMFNWDKFLSNLKPLSAGIDSLGRLSFGLDDAFGYQIFCGAHGEFDEKLRLLRWDNF